MDQYTVMGEPEYIEAQPPKPGREGWVLQDECIEQSWSWLFDQIGTDDEKVKLIRRSDSNGNNS